MLRHLNVTLTILVKKIKFVKHFFPKTQAITLYYLLKWRLNTKKKMKFVFIKKSCVHACVQ